MTDDDFEKVYDFELTGCENHEEQHNLSQEVFRGKKNLLVNQYGLFRSGQSESEDSDGTIEKTYLDLDCIVMLKTRRRHVVLK